MRLTKAKKLKKVFTLLLLMGFIFILPKVLVADETTFIIDIYESERRGSSLIDTAESLMDHDRRYIKVINEVTQKYRKARASREKVLIRLDYVEARALHLKGWIFGIKKLKGLSDVASFRGNRDLLFLRKWSSPEGRTELDGLYNGAYILLVMSKNEASKSNSIESKLKNLGDQVMLIEVCEYYRLMDDINSLRRVIRSEKELNTAFNKNLVFLSRELKHLKNWYVKHARQG